MNRVHDVDIVTLKPEGMRDIIVEALEMNGIRQGKHYNNLIIKSYEKSDIKSTLDYDLYIDDSAGLAESFPVFGKTLLLFDAPANRYLTSGSKFIRVFNWPSIMRFIRVLA